MNIKSPEKIQFKSKIDPNINLRLKNKIGTLLKSKSPTKEMKTSNSKKINIKNLKLNENSKNSTKRNTFAN